nr:uncharacterized protein LOC123771043 [Procambarus clarkii]
MQHLQVVVVGLVASCIGWCGAICVIDNKRGWSIDCGIRDSYLFRLKDYGGFKANFDFGFGFGDEKGFPQSIHNTAGGYHKRNDNTARNSEGLPPAERREDEGILPQRRRVRPGPAFRLRPPPLPEASRRQSFFGLFSPQSPPQNRPLHPSLRRRPQQSGWRIPFLDSIMNPFGGSSQPQPQVIAHGPPPFQHQQEQEQYFLSSSDQVPQVSFDHASSSPHTQPPTRGPTVGPILGEVLKLNSDTPADTDHVPSFAAKMFVVREAPEEFHPPGYSPTRDIYGFHEHVEVPRTRFFCEEQKYLPGIYADTQLGCKVFHLCLPAAMGNTMTSFLCPNMTLFDQSILQCNYWYYVNCENSPNSYDANLPMALSYRKINAAQLTLSGVGNFDSVALLSHNTEDLKKLQSAQLDTVSNVALKRMGEADVSVIPRGNRIGDGIPRQPRVFTQAENSAQVKYKGLNKNYEDNVTENEEIQNIKKNIKTKEDPDQFKIEGGVDVQKDKVNKTELDTNITDHKVIKTELNKNSTDHKVIKTELNKNSTDYEVIKTELDKNSTDYEVNKTELDKNSTDYEVNKTELDKNTTDYEVNKTELDKNSTDHKVNKTELDKNSTDYEVNKTELDKNTTDYEVNKTELDKNSTDHKVNKTELDTNTTVIKTELNKNITDYKVIKTELDKNKTDHKEDHTIKKLQIEEESDPENKKKVLKKRSTLRSSRTPNLDKRSHISPLLSRLYKRHTHSA